MMSPELRLRSISELLTERFFVPAYQRGYRWTARQVEAMLDDLAAFQLRERSPHAYYCLQPVVVRRRPEGEWELVDGQQRLTTIFLVLRALDDIANMLRLGRYEITYETREDSAAFLLEPTPEGAVRNIDYHHMYEAYQAIQRWFDARDGGLRLDLLRCLTCRDGAGPNVRVIWYELEVAQDPVHAFVRLNVGRIPLTSAELIRALLLRSDRLDLDPRDAQQIAQDWDAIERRLQDDGYWYFLQSDRSSPPARIEYIFDVFVRTQLQDAKDGLVDDPLATFLEFQVLLDANGARVWPIWQMFKKLTQTLEDWYEDRTLYHLVGFLVATADKRTGGRSRRAEANVLLDLLTVRQTLTATDFDRHLRRLAWRRFAGNQAVEPFHDGFTEEELAERIGERLDNLDYGKGSVGTALLLFNIAGLLEQVASTQRFQFDAYKTSSWDIEHVRSVAEYIPQAAADRRRWLEHARGFVVSPAATPGDPAEAEQLQKDIDALIASPSPEERAFADVFARVRVLSREPEVRADDNAISNLVLLDMGTNRSYKNAIFPVKRARIISLDKEGQFVPPATRNIFLKYYSPQAAQLMLWDDADQAAYREVLDRTLYRFFAALQHSRGGI
ncbi:MAG TPA: DUF262 domain-containing protein [Kofleriaceae bacterium]|nr:DUF262 domain-containing protein [Kofleriaceae bacterium]